MTDADKIAELEARLEAALRDADDERSSREAVDAENRRKEKRIRELLAILGAARALLDVREVPS